MERLNEIFKRGTEQTPRRRMEGDRRPAQTHTPQQMRPASAPQRRSPPEQIAHQGDFSRAFQSDRKHAWPPQPANYVRSEPVAASPHFQKQPPSPALPASSIPPTPSSRPTGRDEARPYGNHGSYTGPSIHQGDAYQAGAHADVEDTWQEAWDEEENASIRYGDWESDIYDIPGREDDLIQPANAAAQLPSVRQAVRSDDLIQPATPTINRGATQLPTVRQAARSQEHESGPPVGHDAGRIPQSYSQSNRSFATRELQSPIDEEEIISPTQDAINRVPTPSMQRPGPTPYYLSSTPALPPAQAAAQSIAQAQRVTQPLNRSASMPPLAHTPPQYEQDSQRERLRTQGIQERRPQQQRQPGHRGQRPSSPDSREQALQLIPAPYTNPKALCPICKGKGYLRADVPYGHPNFGRPIACECKERERRERRRLQLQELSNLGELRDKRFDNFNVSRAVSEAYQIAREYAEEPEGWLVFIGRVGCGKTHLAAAIANQALANGSRVLFSTVSDLLDHLRATFMPNATEFYDHLFQEMREAELLVLDDLGAQQSSSWANEKLFQLLNYRYNSRFPTIITTNNTGLQGIEDRIRSRIMDFSLVRRITFDQAGDYRLRNPQRE